MIVGIISDTHNEIAVTRRAVSMLRSRGAEVLFHCGDISGAKLVAEFVGVPTYFTFGNHDADNVPELRSAIRAISATSLEWGSIVEVSGRRLGAVHGHNATDVRALLAAQPDFLFSGHSHVPRDEQVGPTRRINPGALYDADQLTAGLLDLETNQLEFLTVAH